MEDLERLIRDEMDYLLASIPPVAPVRRRGRITYFEVLTGESADFAAWESELGVCG